MTNDLTFLSKRCIFIEINNNRRYLCWLSLKKDAGVYRDGRTGEQLDLWLTGNSGYFTEKYGYSGANYADGIAEFGFAGDLSDEDVLLIQQLLFNYFVMYCQPESVSVKLRYNNGGKDFIIRPYEDGEDKSLYYNFNYLYK